ncbi:hypothetical protein K803_19288 [Salmonella enterica subsp. enterica serovar Newport str. SHSN013]|nr:hypothetical protein K803_19288 [Salmonella enterica subsp. enterica serovar Newport str. SHSN013]
MKDAQLNTLCQRHQAVLINSASNSITVAVVDAPSHALLDALHFATQKQIDIVCWTRQQMENHRHKPDQAPSANAAKGGETAAQLLNQTLRSAMAKRASDIHLEPGASRYRIRLRIDGVLHILQDIAKETGLALTARLKVLGNLDIDCRRTGNLPLTCRETASLFVSPRFPVKKAKKSSYGCCIRLNKRWIWTRWACTGHNLPLLDKPYSNLRGWYW